MSGLNRPQAEGSGCWGNAHGRHGLGPGVFSFGDRVSFQRYLPSVPPCQLQVDEQPYILKPEASLQRLEAFPLRKPQPEKICTVVRPGMFLSFSSGFRDSEPPFSLRDPGPGPETRSPGDPTDGADRGVGPYKLRAEGDPKISGLMLLAWSLRA